MQRTDEPHRGSKNCVRGDSDNWISILSLDDDRFRLGEWAVSPQEGTIENQRGTLTLQPKAMELLVYLARHPGQVLSKEQLFAGVWTDLVVEEGALTQCVHSLRKALGCNSRQPTYIATLPRRGYRLLVEVEPLSEEDALPSKDSATPTSTPTTSPKQPSHPWLMLAGTMILATIVSFVWLINAKSSRPPMVVFKRLEPTATDARKASVRAMADSLRQHVYQNLSSVDGLQLGSEQTTKWVENNSDSPRVLKEHGIDYLIEGAFVDRASDVLIQISLFKTTDDSRTLYKVLQAPKSEFDSLAKEISTVIPNALGLNPPMQFSATSQNPEATEAYFQGLSKLTEVRLGDYAPETVMEAVQLFQQATELDPNFLLAQTELTKAAAYLYFNGERKYETEARDALEQARELNSEETEVHLAEANYRYRIEHDYPKALAAFLKVQRDRRHDAEVEANIGYILARQGKLHGAIVQLERTFFDLDQQNGGLASFLATIHQGLKEPAAALEWYERALDIKASHAPRVGEYAILLALSSTCTPSPACAVNKGRAVLDESGLEPHRLSYHRLLLDLYELSAADETMKLKGFQNALERIELAWEATDQQIDDSQTNPYVGKLFWRRAILLKRLGEEAAMRDMAQHYRNYYSEKLRGALDYARHRAFRGMAYAFLGERDAAIDEGQAAVDLAEQRGKFSSPRQKQNLAIIHLILGDHDSCLLLLSELLQTPYQYSLTRRELELDPLWDPLRQDPKFKALIERR